MEARRAVTIYRNDLTALAALGTVYGIGGNMDAAMTQLRERALACSTETARRVATGIRGAVLRYRRCYAACRVSCGRVAAPQPP